MALLIKIWWIWFHKRIVVCATFLNDEVLEPTGLLHFARYSNLLSVKHSMQIFHGLKRMQRHYFLSDLLQSNFIDTLLKGCNTHTLCDCDSFGSGTVFIVNYSYILFFMLSLFKFKLLDNIFHNIVKVINSYYCAWKCFVGLKNNWNVSLDWK